jgi:hypothetical protein
VPAHKEAGIEYSFWARFASRPASF